MVDYSDKCSSESEDMGSQTSQRSPTPDRSSSGTTHQQPQLAKTCADCGTTKTPLWRGGPAGPKSLCNACGIRSRKRRRALLGLNTKAKDENKFKKVLKKTSNNDSKDSGESTSTSADSTSRVRVYGDSMKGGNLLVFGRDVALQRPRSKPNSNSQRRRIGEEEQAAFLLMSLSRGCVYG